MRETLPGDLVAALDGLAAAAIEADVRDPWWVFGGAAMALIGLTDWRVPDIDVLASPGDVRRLAGVVGARIVTDPGEGQFRSRVYARTEGRAVPIEIMAGLEVRTGPDWRPVAFTSRLPVAVDGGTLYIPDVPDQIATARLFGRPKDLARADALQRLSAA
jgi:hypothetical protein